MTRTGAPRKLHVRPRDAFGHGVVIAVDIYVGGARGALLACDCSDGEVVYAAALTDLVRGRVTSCGSCYWLKRLENRQHDQARQASWTRLGERWTAQAGG